MAQARLEAWGGVEYTYNRVRDMAFDQVELSGHAARVNDYAQFAALGITTLRMGLLWERHELDPGWRGFDEHLEALQEAKLRPIAGLVHHGSGPPHTSLMESTFAAKLAVYAGSVAARYPWIDAYTPVNEPNTTARFSCLYGFWYPHETSVKSYLRALINQTKATVLSMRAIREVRSDARLIQTDDLGRTWSTPELSSTCDLLNERRWLGFDLLCGTVDRTHALFPYLMRHGLTDAEVLWFRDNPCPHDVTGINYYVTSDRFLDHRLEMFPHIAPSGDGQYLDVEALRARRQGIGGFGLALTDAWERYAIPTAITEVHLGSKVHEQIRWVVEAWNEALAVQEQGVECVAVTFWALLGSYYWNTLVTSAELGFYEPGVFDLETQGQPGKPVATELADVIAELAHGQRPTHRALRDEGWWRLEDRLTHGSMTAVR